MAQKAKKKPSKKTQTKAAAKAKKTETKAKKTAASVKKAKASTKKAAAPAKGTKPAAQKKEAPKSAKATKSFSIAEFAKMTYLTENGVRNWLHKGLLRGQQNDKGEWQVDASNLEVPNVKRLVR